MLTDAECEAFEADGFVRIRGAFSSAAAARMEAELWATLGEKYGATPDDPATWTVSQATGLQSLRESEAFAEIGGPTTVAALDQLIGAERWKKPKHWGQFLVSFPDPRATWTVPTRIWHTDFGFFPPPRRTFGVLLFSFVSSVPPRSGGTLIARGSHHVIRRFLEEQPPARLARLKMKAVRRMILNTDPWLKALTTPSPGTDRIARYMRADHEIGGVPVRVVELTGEPGDIVLAQPWMLHTAAPNCGARPRLMCAQRIHKIALARGSAGAKSRGSG